MIYLRFKLFTKYLDFFLALGVVYFCTAIASAETYRVLDGEYPIGRSGPGVQYRGLERLDPGDQLTGIGQVGAWHKVRIQSGKEFWVNIRYLNTVNNSNNIELDSFSREIYPNRIRIFPSIGHSDYIGSVALSPDGRQLLTGSSDTTAKLWNLETGDEIHSFKGHTDVINSVSFSYDGQRILTGSDDNTARIWDVGTGKQIKLFNHPSYSYNSDVIGVAFSPDGRSVLTGSSDGIARLWDVGKPRVIRAFNGHSEGVRSVAFSPDGDFVLTGSMDKTAKLWIASTGLDILTFDEHTAMINSVAFSSDGLQVLTGSSDKTAILWNSSTGTKIRAFEGHAGEVTSVAFTRNGLNILTGSSDRSVILWNLETGNKIDTITGHARVVSSIAADLRGRYLVTGSYDRTASLWDLDTGNNIRIFEGAAKIVNSVAFNSNGRLMMTGSGDNTANLWDTSIGHRVRSFGGHTRAVKSVAFSPDGQHAFTGSWDKTAKLWDIKTGKEIRTFLGHSSGVHSVAYRPDGRYALTGSSDGNAILWDVHDGQKVRTFEGHSGAIFSAAFSPNGRRLLTGSEDATTRLWNVDLGQKIRTAAKHFLPVIDVDFSPDGHHLLSGSLDGSVAILDVTSGKIIQEFPKKSGLLSLAYSPNGKFVLLGYLHDPAALFKVETGQLVRTFGQDSKYITSVSFSPDGNRALTGSNDTTTRIWDVASGKERAQFVSFTDGSWVVLTPEGFFNASEGGEKHINVVRGLEVLSVDQVYDALYRPDLVREALAGDPDGKVAAAAAELDLEKIIEGGFPPQLSLIAPEAETTVVDGGSGSNAVDVEVELVATSGGIGKVEWSVNGVLQDLSERGLAPLVLADDVAGAGTIGETKRVARSLYLAPGENEIKIVAYNAADLIASDPLIFNVTLDEPEITDPKLYVLSVGVNDYFDSRLDLAYAASDARAIGSALQIAGKEIYSDIIVETVFDKDVTKEGLEAAFSRLENKVRPGDVFVFFLAGHGKTEDGRYYFLPHDFRYSDENSFKTAGIGQTTLQEWFSKIRAQKSVLLFDTCESGTLTQEPAVRGTEALTAISRLNRAIGRTTLTASTDTAPALEGFRGHGLFTYTLLDAISEADNDNDRLVDVTEIASYIDRRLPEYSEAAFGYTQVPQMKVLGNNFPLARTTTVLSADTSSHPIRKTPTHVVIKLTDVLARAVDGGAVITKLKPGTLVTLMTNENSWMLIAKDGKELGYVETTAMAPVQ